MFYLCSDPKRFNQWLAFLSSLCIITDRCVLMWRWFFCSSQMLQQSDAAGQNNCGDRGSQRRAFKRTADGEAATEPNCKLTICKWTALILCNEIYTKDFLQCVRICKCVCVNTVITQLLRVNVFPVPGKSIRFSMCHDLNLWIPAVWSFPPSSVLLPGSPTVSLHMQWRNCWQFFAQAAVASTARGILAFKYACMMAATCILHWFGTLVGSRTQPMYDVWIMCEQVHHYLHLHI